MKKRFKVLTLMLSMLLVLSLVPEANADKAATTKRLAGNNRVETSIEVSKKAYPGKVDTVVLAGYDGQADALTGTLLADKKDAPLLLTYKNKLDRDLLKEIKRLGASNVYILGGEKVIYKSVEKDLEKEGLQVKRLRGDNRINTAISIMNEAFKGSKPEEAFIVEYNALVDALSIGSVAAKKSAPILITKKDELPSDTEAYIKENNIDKATIIGGEAVISSEGKSKLGNIVKDVSRIFGNNRTETSLAVAKEYNPNASNLILANGRTLPDALVGGYLAARIDASILLVNKNSIGSGVVTEIRSAKSNIYILGGKTVITPSVENEVKGIVSGLRDGDKEPNDTFAQASTLYLNDKLRGRLSEDRDSPYNVEKDYYKVEVPKDGTLNLDVSNEQGVRLELRLYGSKLKGHYIEVNRGGVTQQISRPLEEGTYYVVLNIYDARGKPCDYILESSFDENKYPDDFPMVNADINYVNAPKLDMNKEIYGHIGYTDEFRNTNRSDYYKLVIPSDGEVDIEATKLGSGEMHFSLYGEYGTDGRSIKHKFHTVKANISAPLKKGTYYIGLENGVGYGAYKLDFKHTPQEIQDDNASSEFINGPTIDKNSTNYGRIGYIDSKGQDNKKDFYKLNLTENTNLNIEAANLDGKKLSLYLYDENGDDEREISKEEGKIKPNISKNLEKGTYYILVESYIYDYGGYSLKLSSK